MEIFLQPDTWGALVTLTFLEIVLGIDNIIFISIAANKLPENLQKKATNIGLVLAMVLRIVLLFGISLLIAMNAPLFHVDFSWFKAGVTGQALILFAGGIFLLYKSTKEIHHKVEGHEEDTEDGKPQKGYTLTQAIIQITLINIVFSFDSILTAVGMTNGVEGAMIIMIASVVLSMVIMMLFANPVGKFVNKHPTIQMLGLSFLILIGFMLIAESAHLSHAKLFGEEIGTIPKGYLYFAITFSLLVEMLNMKMRGNSKK
ncbi:TerC family protein [Tenacibaculum aiptasiae]|uniref:TerC family protein n=1 Tax=Tenacibaculum aiptasiae TaxID=426481 RepID=UPI00232BF567|nr:TerC family protein [Tenacibaculum aiptasiae]